MTGPNRNTAQRTHTGPDCTQLDTTDNRSDAIFDRIRVIRTLSRMTREQFAHAVDASRSSVGRWERSERMPSVAEARAICARFGLDANWFLLGIGHAPATISLVEAPVLESHGAAR